MPRHHALTAMLSALVAGGALLALPAGGRELLLNSGFEEGIALDSFGFVSEGSGENIFLVRNGAIYTPPTSSSILPGII